MIDFEPTDGVFVISVFPKNKTTKKKESEKKEEPEEKNQKKED